MQENLIKTLNEITNILKRKSFYKYINYGGCGHFAYLIAVELKKINAMKNTKIKFKIKKVLDLDINHVFLEFTELSVYYDSEGIVSDFESFFSYGYEIRSMTFNSLQNKNIKDDWNKKFPRESLRIIEHIIKTEFHKNFSLQIETIQ